MIVVDVSIDAPESLIEKIDKVIPIYLIDPKSNKVYKITFENRYLVYENKELFEKLKKGYLKTSIPSKEDVLKILDKRNSGYVFTLSSKLSNLYNFVSSLVKEYNYNYEVIDTKQTSVGLGIYLYKFLRREELKVNTIAYLDNSALKILLNSGRINILKYTFLKYTKLNVKFTLEEGEGKVKSLFFGSIVNELKKDLKNVDNYYLLGISKEFINEKLNNKILINSIVLVNLGFPSIVLSY